MCYFVIVILMGIFVILVLFAGTSSDVNENEEPWVGELPEEKPAGGIQRPKVCSVTYDYRYKGSGMQFVGDKYICRWVAVCRGHLIGNSSWFIDHFATKVDLRRSIPYVGAFLVPSLKRQQDLLDKTREIGATNYWRLVEALEGAGWQCVYSNDGTASSMVKTNLPASEPLKPRKMGELWE